MRLLRRRATVVAVAVALGCYEPAPDVSTSVCRPGAEECADEDFDGDGVANRYDAFPTDDECQVRDDENCSACGVGCDEQERCSAEGECVSRCEGLQCSGDGHCGSCGDTDVCGDAGVCMPGPDASPTECDDKNTCGGCLPLSVNAVPGAQCEGSGQWTCTDINRMQCIHGG